MQNQDIHEVIEVLREEVKQWEIPVVTQIAERRDPFRVLISTVLSLRTKDEVTGAASERLFALATDPNSMLQLTAEQISEAIYPVGFHTTKAQNILGICDDILQRYGGRVPDEIGELLTMRGVGRKTANLVVTLGYGKPGICVDTHVHRITNRWGYVETKTPDKTEFALREKLPQEYWITINDLLVAYGQNLCRPVSPFCSRCQIVLYCERIGVDRSR